MVVTIILAALLVGAIVLLLRKHDCPSPPPCGEGTGWIENNYFIDGLKIKGKNMALTAFPQQRIPFLLQPVDRKGNPAPVEAGSVTFSIDNPAVASVEQDPANQLAGFVITNGVGVTQINYSADADMGEGVTTITGFDAIEVKPEQAVGFGITFGPAEDIEETP